MKTETTKQRQAQPVQPEARLLGRQLARELTREAIEAIAGGQRKAPTHDNGGTGSGMWGNLDD